jgi:hypothetical protein
MFSSKVLVFTTLTPPVLSPRSRSAPCRANVVVFTNEPLALPAIPVRVDVSSPLGEIGWKETLLRLA